MPYMEDINNFTNQLLKYLPEYEFADEHLQSRVSLIMKKSLNKKQFINFNKFFSLIENNKNFTAEDYSSKKLE